MKLFSFQFQPCGHAPLSFFVCAEDVESAYQYIKKHIDDEEIPVSDYCGLFEECYDMSELSVGEVAINENS